VNGPGGLCLILVAVLCLAGLLLALAAAATRRPGLLRGAVGAVYAIAALVVIGSVVLLVALVTRDFGNAIRRRVSRSPTPSLPFGRATRGPFCSGF